MITYGIDPGLSASTTSLVQLDDGSSKLTVLKPLAAMPQSLKVHSRDPKELSAVANRLAQEILQRELFPLAIDAPLTCPPAGKKKRLWETNVVGAFSTPEWSKLNLGKTWHMLTFVWTQVALALRNAGVVVWSGDWPMPTDGRIVIEVYPRVSWTTLLAWRGWHLWTEFRTCPVKWRDFTLDCAGFTWVKAPINPVKVHPRDAAVGALNMLAVWYSNGRYLGEQVLNFAGAPCLVGGGIATF